MGRTTLPITLTKVQREALVAKREAFAKAGKPRLVEHCRAVELCADRWELADIARGVGRPYSTVQRWLREYRKEGLRSVDPEPKSGRPRKLGSHERMLLGKAIQRGPGKEGYASGVWTSPMIADYIKNRWDVEYSPAHVRKILNELDFSLQYP